MTSFNAYLTTIARPGAERDTQIVSLHPDQIQLTKTPVTIEMRDGEYFEMTTESGGTIYTTDLHAASISANRAVVPGSITILTPDPSLPGHYLRSEIRHRVVYTSTHTS